MPDRSAPQDTDVTYVIVFNLHPNTSAQFRDLLDPVLDAMRHETTFRNAVLHKDPQDVDRYMLYETWSSEQDVTDVQIHRPYRQEFWEKLPSLLKDGRDVQTWHPLRADWRE